MGNHLDKNFILKLLSFQISCLALATIICLGTFYSLEYFKYHHKIYKNIQICHIDLSGKTSEEAISIIETQVINKLLTKELSLNLNDSSIQIPIHDYYLSSNLEEVIEETFSYISSLTFMERLQLLCSNETKNFNISLELDDDALIESVKDSISRFNKTSSDASISINTEGQITTVPHVNGQCIDKQSLRTKLMEVLEEFTLKYPSYLRFKTDVPSEESLLEPFQIDLNEYLNITEADIQVETLNQINALISNCSTSFSTSASNSTNIDLAARAINNTLLMPGEVFSFNHLVGDTTLDKGYVYAPVIVNSQVTQGVGGGVCQVSSTLYSAILSAGLLPLERQPHSRPSSYLPLGLDSTIDWNNIDLKFQNTLDFPLYISAFTQSGKLHINLYSNESLLETHYELSSQIIKVLPASTRTIKDSSLPVGTRILTTSGSNGYYVKVIRDAYHNDQLVSSEVISWDTYRPVNAVYRVG